MTAIFALKMETCLLSGYSSFDISNYNYSNLELTLNYNTAVVTSIA